MAVCGFWFYKAFQKIGEQRPGGKIGILLFVLFLGIAIQHGILALGGLFFGGNSEALYAVLVIDFFVLAAVAALGVYLAFYILLPRRSPWLATATTFIFGVLVVGLIIVIHPQPFIDVKNSIDWNMPQWLDAFAYLVLLLNIGSIFIIFTKNFFYAITRDVKIVSLIISLLAFAGIINVSILFTPLFTKPTIRTQIFDIIMGIIGLVFIVVFLLIPIIAGWPTGRSKAKIESKI
ncbi:MAG: hypothetical protein HYT19_01855 [Candidatus Nealsonbacteria bacterium]|nr:hypothetical protein [Candidatus Nealsonbacteria bacterium]